MIAQSSVLDVISTEFLHKMYVGESAGRDDYARLWPLELL